MKASNNNIQQTIQYWSYLMPYIHVPSNENEYEKSLALVEKLMELSRQKKDERITSFLKLIAKNIESYENNKYPSTPVSPIEMLQFLMEEHGLEQNDLPEIGSQSLVSKILSGERQLTREHIEYLSKRFGVSPAVFFHT